ncbi:MAG TPA: DEAD/DEAH box helicase [Verrucomicrobiae bacterium]|nr:DEAD/DEAH box helicase [Verrucomicrobiae bacterium]
MSFDTLGLADGLLRAVADEGYSIPTPIQARAIPEILANRDLLAAAQTGTGKTAAFTLPLLQKLSAHVPTGHRRIRVLVLVPTRELAAQVNESVRTYGRHLPQLKTALIFGGVSFNPQADHLRRGVDIVVATPGRLLDHAQQRTIDLSHVEVLVLDEADRMLDMGFIHDIRRVLKLLPAKRQNLMFSATFSEDIRQLANGILRTPVSIDIAPRNSAVETVTQRLVMAGKHDKAGLLSHLIRTGDWRQTLVFTRTKRGANKLAERLARDGITTDALHGNKSQNARTRALDGFKAGQVRVLVATDIAARGLDIDMLPHVVNYELPNVPEDYVHRIGRTGRAGLDGEALSIVGNDERDELRAIERMLKRSIEVIQVEGYVPSAEPAQRPQQHQQPRQGHGGHGRSHGQGQRQGRGGRGGHGHGGGGHKGQGGHGNRQPQRAPEPRTAPSGGNAAPAASHGGAAQPASPAPRRWSGRPSRRPGLGGR